MRGSVAGGALNREILPESRPMFRRLAVLAVLLAACAGGEAESAPVDSEIPPIDAAEFEQLIETSDRPLVVNLWASWCVPCRSEAPLLVEAHSQYADELDFVGIATQDTQGEAIEFIEEFSLPFDNYFDPSADVRAWVGSVGLPTTFFVAPGGEVVSTVFGVVDERRLALEIDDLLAR